MIAKYTYMMESNARRAAGLKDKIPDIKKTLQMVQFLDTKNKKGDEEPISTMFELSDTLYAKASVTPPSEVYLWLGANVMLAYPNEEAIAMLKQKLSAAQESLRNCEEDIDFLRQQITTLEVNTSRMYNWNISLQRKEKEKTGSK
ncbi:peptide chain release factor 1 [Arthrobotrys megalospora]